MTLHGTDFVILVSASPRSAAWQMAHQAIRACHAVSGLLQSNLAFGIAAGLTMHANTLQDISHLYFAPSRQ